MSARSDFSINSCTTLEERIEELLREENRFRNNETTQNFAKQFPSILKETIKENTLFNLNQIENRKRENIPSVLLPSRYKKQVEGFTQTGTSSSLHNFERKRRKKIIKRRAKNISNVRNNENHADFSSLTKGNKSTQSFTSIKTDSRRSETMEIFKLKFDEDATQQELANIVNSYTERNNLSARVKLWTEADTTKNKKIKTSSKSKWISCFPFSFCVYRKY